MGRKKKEVGCLIGQVIVVMSITRVVNFID